MPHGEHWAPCERDVTNSAQRTLPWRDVLILSRDRRSQKTIRRCFDVWRSENRKPNRCDNPDCKFHLEPLRWNNESLKRILDHEDGNRFNNLPNNLRYLCPNCDSQLSTCGGANRGRVEMTSNDGYILKNRDGSKVAGSKGRSHGKSRATAIGVASTGKNESGA